MFKQKGLITVNQSDADEDELMEMALSAGAEDMTSDADMYEITCDPSAFQGLKNALEEREIPTQVAEISMIPESNIAIDDVDTARKILGLMEDLEDHDDVQNVYSNFDISDEVMSQIQ
jgi:transcriptional/translational regulatory protein YebC/TACO1